MVALDVLVYRGDGFSTKRGGVLSYEAHHCGPLPLTQLEDLGKEDLGHLHSELIPILRIGSQVCQSLGLLRSHDHQSDVL